MVNVRICMGSSCFSRGNSKTLSLINEYIKHSGLEKKVLVSGSLCEGKCSTGPHITVNEIVYDNITAETAIDIIQNAVESKDG